MLRKIAIVALALATIALVAVWSYSVKTQRPLEVCREYSARGSYMAVFNDGQIRLSHWFDYSGPMSNDHDEHSMFGFGYMFKRIDTPHAYTLQIHRFWFPAWFALILCGGYPAFVATRRVLRFAQNRRYRCRHCGYALIGLSAARCPECGRESAGPAEIAPEDYREPWSFVRLRNAVVILLIFTVAGFALLIAVRKPWQRSPTPAPPPPVTNRFTPTRLSPAQGQLVRQQLPPMPEFEMDLHLRQLMIINSPTPGGSSGKGPRVFMPSGSVVPVDGKTKIPKLFAYGCPECGRRAVLRRRQGGCLSRIPTLEDAVAYPDPSQPPPHKWYCTICQATMMNPWKGDAHPAHEKCPYCDYSESDEAGELKPWPTCLCPRCGIRHWP